MKLIKAPSRKKFYLLMLVACIINTACEKETYLPTDTSSSSSLKYEIVAGSITLSGLVNGTGLSASFYNPTGLSIDNTGGLIIADTRNNAIRRMNLGFAVSTITGQGPNISQAGNNDGSLSEARFWNPYFITVDPAGNIYILDGMSNYIRKIVGGQVTTVTERLNGIPRYLNRILDLPNTYAGRGIAFDKVTNRLILTIDGSRIWAVNPVNGQINVLAGTGVSGYQDGASATSKFTTLGAVTVDATGNIYVADNYRKPGISAAFNTRIRKITPAGNVTTLATFEGTRSQYINALAIDKDGTSLVAFICQENIVGTSVEPNAAFYRLIGVSATGVVSEIMQAVDPYNAAPTETFVFGRAEAMVVDATTGAIYLSHGVIGKISGR
jgi:hypothetical protein